MRVNWKRWLIAIVALLICTEVALFATGRRVLLRQRHIAENPDEAQEEAYRCTYFTGSSIVDVRLWAGLYEGCPMIGDRSLDEPQPV